MTSGDFVQSRFVQALRTQAKAESPPAGVLPCPYSTHRCAVFKDVDQLFHHAKVEHASQIEGLDPRQARVQLKEAALKLR